MFAVLALLAALVTPAAAAPWNITTIMSYDQFARLRGSFEDHYDASAMKIDLAMCHMVFSDDDCRVFIVWDGLWPADDNLKRASRRERRQLHTRLASDGIHVPLEDIVLVVFKRTDYWTPPGPTTYAVRAVPEYK